MFNGKKIIAIIPARGGSKGIPRKNITLLSGEPLIKWSINTALKCSFCDEVIVSTDDLEIKQIAIQAGASVPFLRPAHLATDTAKTVDVICDVLQHFKKLKKQFDIVILLQPTQPFRTTEDIEQALKIFFTYGEQGVISVSEVEEHPILMRTFSPHEPFLKSILNLNSTVRRQDFPKVVRVNGALYINKIDDYSRPLSLNDNPIGYIMPNYRGFDIDEPKDLYVAQQIIEKHNLKIA